jgi:hypothetical protein
VVELLQIVNFHCVVLEIRPNFKGMSTEGNHFVAASNAEKDGDEFIFKVSDSMGIESSVKSSRVVSAIVTWPQIVEASVMIEGERFCWQPPSEYQSLATGIFLFITKSYTVVSYLSHR